MPILATGFLFILASLGVDWAAPVCMAVMLATIVLALAAGRPRGDVLLEAARTLEGGEDAGEVARRLRGVELQGRAGLCLGVARRCLEGAGRSGRLEARLSGGRSR